MLSLIKGFLILKNESFEIIFNSDRLLLTSTIIITLSCLSGASHPFLIESNQIKFSTSEFLTKFIGLLSQNIFIISGIYFLGVSFFANKNRIGLTSDNEIINDNEYKLINIRRMFQLLSFSQIPVIFGMISTLPFISSIAPLVSIIIFFSTIWLYILITKSIYVGFGFNYELNASIQVRYIKSFLIILFTYMPGTIIFQLFISSLINNLITSWI